MHGQDYGDNLWGWRTYRSNVMLITQLEHMSGAMKDFKHQSSFPLAVQSSSEILLVRHATLPDDNASDLISTKVVTPPNPQISFFSLA